MKDQGRVEKNQVLDITKIKSSTVLMKDKSKKK